MKKRGISAVVAMVLIILIVVVAVMIIWSVVIPSLDTDLDPDESRVSIVISKGYTVYDGDKRFAFVQVSRGEDDENVTRLNFIFNIGGTSVTYRTGRAPTSNGEKTYSFNFSRDGIEGTPDFVSVAPVYFVNSKEALGGITSKVRMPVKSAKVVPEDDQASMENQIEIGTSGGNGGNGGSGGGTIPLTDCDTLNVEGGDYLLQKDVSSSLEHCFVIEADNINLNLGGKVVMGGGFLQYDGVYSDGYNYLKIYNGEINNFGAGVNLRAGINHEVYDISFIDNSVGIFLHLINNSFFHNSDVSTELPEGSGVRGFDVNNSNFTYLNVSGLFRGISFQDVYRNNINNNIANFNALEGLYLTRSFDNSINSNEFCYNFYNAVPKEGISFRDILTADSPNYGDSNVFDICLPEENCNDFLFSSPCP
jgi:parallel beta-helix repeat protein